MSKTGQAKIPEQNSIEPEVEPPSALLDKRVVVTRAAGQAAGMVHLLLGREAVPILYPCIDIVHPEDTIPLDDALHKAAAGEFDWLVITSSNTVEALARRLDMFSIQLGQMKVAAIGLNSANMVRERLGREVDLIPDIYVAETLAAALVADATDARQSHILLPQSNLARSVLTDRLEDNGAAVTAVVAYRTVMGQGGEDVPSMLSSGQIEAITFTSPSAVRYFMARINEEGAGPADLEGVCLAAIGPITAGALEEFQLSASVTPAAYSAPALIASIENYFSQAD